MVLLSIDGIIYFYMYICTSLLVFNFGYILRDKRKIETITKRVKKVQKVGEADESCT